MKPRILLVFSLVVMLLSSYLIIQYIEKPSKRVTRMNCEPLTPEQLKYHLKRFNKKYVFQPDKNDIKKVHFSFNLNLKDTNKTLFFIKSRFVKDRGRKAILYIGPYKNEIEVLIDSRLAKNEYHDNINFQLLLVGDKKICGWANSLEYPYWKPNNKITIDFLEEKRIDENELVYMFDVNIR